MKTGGYLQIILSLVAEECGESVEDICSASRRMELVRCRTMYCAVAWKLMRPALRDIAEPINRCVTSVEIMIQKHSGITDRLYLAAFERVRKKAAQRIFGDAG